MKFAFASFIIVITSLTQSKRSGRTTLRSDTMVGNSSKWWFLQNHTQKLLLLFLVTSKRELFQVTSLTSGLFKNFSIAFHDMKFVFAIFLMIISIFQSQRGGCTTISSDSMDGNVWKWWFFETHNKDLLYLTLPWPVTSKREFSQVTRVTSRCSKKFSAASHNMNFVFASFFMIISISQSRRGGRTMLNSDSTGGNVSKWWFLKFHYHWT